MFGTWLYVMSSAKFIHGDRVVHMIDVPDEDLEAFLESLQEQFGPVAINEFEDQFKDFIKSTKPNDD